jgi:hypothetical protein
LPPNFQWSSSGVLISPKPDATHHIVSIKDPSVVRYNRWIVYATTANTAGNVDHGCRVPGPRPVHRDHVPRGAG